MEEKITHALIFKLNLKVNIDPNKEGSKISNI